jgi:peptidoglycan/LPS O-acetylase OafA/YrhL
MPTSLPSPARAAEPVKLTQGGSFLLDIVRFSAAVAVFASHFLSILPGVPMVAIGHEAVWIFFVLSGFVIRFITVTRRGTVREYAIDRASRIYSVVLPSLLFAFAMEAVAHGVLLHGGMDPLSGPHAWAWMMAQFATSMTATATCWGYEVLPVWNSPLWSLSYEVMYYAMYAVVFFRVRGRWFWLTLLALVAGPSVVLMGLVWWLGCGLCDLYLILRRRADGLRAGLVATACVLLGIAAMWRVIARWMVATDDLHRNAWITGLMAGRLPKFLVVDGVVPWLSRASLVGLVIGLGSGALLLSAMLLMDRFLPDLPPKQTEVVRVVADSTFALYLFHLPLLQLIEVVVPRLAPSAAGQILLLVGIPAVMVPVAMGLDRFKLVLRRELRRVA